MNDGYTIKPEELKVDKVLIEEMLAHIVLCPQVYQTAARHLQAELFDATEAVWRAVWVCTQAYVQQYQSLPPREMLSAFMHQFLRSDPTIDPVVLNEADAIVSWIWETHPTTQSLSPLAAVDFLQAFLHQRKIDNKLREFVQKSQYQQRMPSVIEFIDSVRQDIQKISTIRQTTRIELIPDELETDRPDPVPCGIEVFDRRMDGGNQPKEVNVILAPSGVGKSMCAVDIVCSRAERQLVLEEQRPGSGKLAVLISFEEDTKTLRPRFWCRLGDIHKSRADKLKHYGELSREGNLQEYEQIRYRQQLTAGLRVPGEYERLFAAKRWSDKFVHVGDFSGSKEGNQTARGFGGIPEIRNYLDIIMSETGREIDTVCIDWAGVCVRRHLANTKTDGSALSGKLLEFVDNVYHQITSPLNCVGHVFHQIQGALNDRPPTFKFHHSHAEWCAGFAVNAWFAHVLSTKDVATSTCIARTTKTRRGEGMQEAICLIDGAYGRLREDTSLMIDPATGRIASRNDVDMFDETAATRRSGRVAPSGW